MRLDTRIGRLQRAAARAVCRSRSFERRVGFRSAYDGYGVFPQKQAMQVFACDKRLRARAVGDLDYHMADRALIN